jgi:hypothetical protein
VTIPRMPVDAHAMSLEIEKLKKKVKDLGKELEKETIRKRAAFKQEERLEEENRELRRQRFRTFNDEEYLIFFDDGEDYPESMSAPVVMSADKFRELFYARGNADWEAAPLGAVKLVQQGSSVLWLNSEGLMFAGNDWRPFEGSYRTIQEK